MTVDLGEALTVSFTVENTGTLEAAAPWVDRLVLSVDGILGNGDDVNFAQINRTAALASGASYPVALSEFVPYSLATGEVEFFESEARG